MTKILVLNQATTHPLYSIIDNLSKTTWPRRTHSDVHVVHYYGAKTPDGNLDPMFVHTPNESTCITYPYTNGETNNDIMLCDACDVVNIPQKYDTRNIKLIMAYEHALANYEFDFIVRVCNTTYVDISKMHRFFERYPRKKRVYNGARNLHNLEYYFVSGFGNYMSRDVVEELVKHKKEFLELEYPLNIEDVAVGYMVLYKLECAENGKNGYADWDTINHIMPRDCIEAFDATNYSFNDDVFLYRFGLDDLSVKKYIQFHNTVIENTRLY